MSPVVVTGDDSSRGPTRDPSEDSCPAQTVDTDSCRGVVDGAAGDTGLTPGRTTATASAAAASVVNVFVGDSFASVAFVAVDVNAGPRPTPATSAAAGAGSIVGLIDGMLSAGRDVLAELMLALALPSEEALENDATAVEKDDGGGVEVTAV